MKIIKLSAIDSTNNYLKNLSKEKLVKDGCIVVARQQKKGRGQMNNTWQSQEGKSLTFSMFKRFDCLKIEEQSAITFAVSLGVQLALKKMNIPAVRVKWPNDIMSYNKKIAGILIESNLQKDRIVASVIGIGVNVNETEFTNLPHASSIKLENGNAFDLEEVLHCIAEAVLFQLQRIEKKEVDLLKNEYETVLFKKNNVSVFQKKTGNPFNGIIRGVSKSGELLLENEDEQLEKFELKEIKMLL
ncbi:biotin--[acetyl-CoA-carboxylase] ligase [Jejudonia soesokkakensis]|uniref:Biotin--[acetyl-CoA-carboxylase] ligase n=1 Tax=Jejudonia soesokkakensis TaxID=1323432 RepID=A0ABW2MXD9_9FLAO